MDITHRNQEKGKGTPIILCHGMAGPKVWDKVADILAEKYEVIIPTFPGYLEEDGQINYSDEVYVEFLDKVVTSLGHKTVPLVGMSMGGRTVLNYALKYPEKVSQLILIDSAGMNDFSFLFNFSFMKNIISKMVIKLLSNPDKRKKFVVADLVDKESKVAENTFNWFSELVASQVIKENFADILVHIGQRKSEWIDRLPLLQIPALLLWGSEDKTCPLRYGTELNNLLPQSRMEILEGYNHLGILENPGFFIDHINNFFENY